MRGLPPAKKARLRCSRARRRSSNCCAKSTASIWRGSRTGRWTSNPPGTLGRDLHVFEVAGLVVDADAWRGDPAGELARLGHRLHQAGNKVAVVLRRQPLPFVAIPCRVVDQRALGRNLRVLEFADLAVEADVRQLEFEADADLVDDLVPA